MKYSTKKIIFAVVMAVVVVFGAVSMYKCNEYKNELDNYKDYELKECPFCGGEAKISESYGRFVVECTKCDSRGACSLPTKKEAVDQWNRRAE